MSVSKVEFFVFLFLIGVISAILVLASAFFIFRGGNGTLGKSGLLIAGKVLSVEIARSTLEKARGLSGREFLGSDGMLFIFDKAGKHGFWMKDMKFQIDMIWIKDGEVIGFEENAMPEPDKQIWELKIYYPPDVADYVLEVEAGFVAQNNIKIGDEAVLGQF